MTQIVLKTEFDTAAASEQLTFLLSNNGNVGFVANSDLFKVPEGSDLQKAATLLVQQAQGPEKEVAAGNAPHAPTVNLSPPFDSSDVAKMDAALTDMSSITALYSAIWNVNKLKQRGRTEPYRISDAGEASQACTDVADSVWEAIQTALPGYYNISTVLVNSYKKNIRRTEVHLEFLNEIFKDFTLTKVAMQQLDGVLTKFVAQLSNIEISKESVEKDVCQTVTLDQILRINSSGDDENPVWLYKPIKRLIYLKIKADSWSNTVKVGKNEVTDVGLDFDMEYRVVDATLNVSKYLENKARFDELFKTLTNANLQAFGQAVKTEPIKGADPKS